MEQETILALARSLRMKKYPYLEAELQGYFDDMFKEGYLYAEQQAKEQAMKSIQFVCDKLGLGKFIDKNNYWFTTEELYNEFLKKEDKA